LLWSFGAGGDGGFPGSAGVITDASGNLYGTTAQGGANSQGIAFELTPPSKGQSQWGEKVLWNFGAGSDGRALKGGVIADASNNLYGTTDQGGTNGQGTVFELTPRSSGRGQWNEQILWNFGGGDGQNPEASLLADASGNLYGTTNAGGRNGQGTVFELTPPSSVRSQWSEKVLWSFGGRDGQGPEAGLIADHGGNLYGTTTAGGTRGQGTVFQLTPPNNGQTQWKETVLWNFGAGGDGQNPEAGLIVDARGNLYGTTNAGGRNGQGAVFELTPPMSGQTQWKERVLWNFGAGGDGRLPQGSLIAGASGDLYGTTYAGGANALGAVFVLTPPAGGHNEWSESLLLNLGAGNDGQAPKSGLIADASGNLYGTTDAGGANGSGTVFKVGTGATFQSPVPTVTPTATATATPTETPTASGTETPQASPTPTSTATATQTATPTSSPTPRPKPHRRRRRRPHHR
jgi:uncharacterized repeat protein (TIGR03803 family)